MLFRPEVEKYLASNIH